MRHFFGLSRALALASGALSATGLASGGVLQLQEVAGASGVAVTHDTPAGSAPIPMFPGGSAGDFNRDGWQDMYVIMGGREADCLFMNNGDGTFTNYAESAGVAWRHVGAGASVGDYNADGWLDIFVTSWGPTGEQPGMHRLYRNNADGTFTDVAVAAGVNQTAANQPDGFGSAFGDYDLDGDLDLFVTGWILQSGGNRLFRNNGDETFTDTTANLNYNLRVTRGFSPRFVDMDGDRYPELLVAADYGTSKYFINNRNGTFTEATSAANVGHDENGMGNTVGDFNGDGLIDWYVTSIFADSPNGPYGNKLYINHGNHLYAEIADAAGVDDGGWGWGTAAIDLNHDGLLDIAETNGWTNAQWLNERAYIYLNQGSLQFASVGPLVGMTHDGQGRGLMNFDYDNDGDQDVAIFSLGETLELFRNDLSGSDRNWLRLTFETHERPDLAPDGFGTRVEISVGGVAQTRYLDAGCNFLSQSELAAHFGVGAATTIDEVRVTWANGRTTVLEDVPANQTVHLAVAFPTDLDTDGDVDIRDLARALSSFNRCKGDTGFNPLVDFDGSGCIEIADLSTLLMDFGLSR